METKITVKHINALKGAKAKISDVGDLSHELSFDVVLAPGDLECLLLLFKQRVPITMEISSPQTRMDLFCTVISEEKHDPKPETVEGEFTEQPEPVDPEPQSPTHVYVLPKGEDEHDPSEPGAPGNTSDERLNEADPLTPEERAQADADEEAMQGPDEMLEPEPDAEPQYYMDGHEVSKEFAFNEDGTLKDGISVIGSGAYGYALKKTDLDKVEENDNGSQPAKSKKRKARK